MSDYRGFTVEVGRKLVWANHPERGGGVAQAWHSCRMWNLKRPTVREAVFSVCRQIDAYLQREADVAQQIAEAEQAVREEQQMAATVDSLLV